MCVRRVNVLVMLLIALVVMLCACGSSGSGTGQGSLSFAPTMLPVTLSLNSSGITISGSKSLATPIGVFSVGASYALPTTDNDNIYVILRDRTAGFDHIYRVTTGSGDFTAVVNGTTTIQVNSHRQVTIDVTNGSVKTVGFSHTVAQAIPENPQGAQQRWTYYWATMPYQPFWLARHVYDDSTIGKWIPFGFIWFMIRLFVTIIVGVVDLVLMLAFLLAGIAFAGFGATGRNVMFGLEPILFIVGIIWLRRNWYWVWPW